MRVVVDTNVLVSGLLWKGAPSRIILAAETGDLEFCTSAPLLAELRDVLTRPKFAKRLAMGHTRPEELADGFRRLATIVAPALIPPTVGDDPDDDQLLACALAANAEAIISGDRHLLALKAFKDIPVLTVAEFLQRRKAAGYAL